MHQPQAAEAGTAAAQAPDVGQHQMGRVADDDVADGAVAFQENTDLAPQVAGDLAQVLRELAGDHSIRRHAPPVGTLERFAL